MATTQHSLFDLPPAISPVMRIFRDSAAASGFDLRDYQVEDVDATVAALDAGARSILYVAATGTGKSVYLAEMARILVSRGFRVLTAVDVSSLAIDLQKTVKRHTGERCGLLSENKEHLDADIIASTVQTLYSRCRRTGQKRYEWAFNPFDKWALLVDECESAIAKEYMAVCRYFLDGNPENILIGTTATPMRGDKRGLGELFEHAKNESGPLNRNIQWACDNGWLVRPRQAFVRVSIDFSTLKVKKQKNGEKDYSEDDLSALLMDEDEKALREFAIGIHKIAKGQPSIIIVPTVDIAERLVGHIRACAGPSTTYAVSSRDNAGADRDIERFKRGEFPYIVSCSKLYKGFDHDEIRFVFMGRKTQSQRIYLQAMGRGTRPLKGIREALGVTSDPAARRAIISASDKPVMTMVDLVGIKPSVKDMTVLDVLGQTMPLEAREHAKRKMLDDAGEEDESIDAEQAIASAADELAEQERARLESERRKRELVEVEAHVDIEFTDNLRASPASAKSNPISRLIGSLTTRFKIKPEEMKGWDVEKMKHVNGKCIARQKKGLCSWRQAKILNDTGVPREVISNLRGDVASEIITAIKANNWRPVDYQPFLKNGGTE